MLFFTVVLIFYLSLSQPVSATTSPLATLSYATYSGLTLPNNVNQFLGLPYAQPPLGPLRWRSPSPPLPSPSPSSQPIPATEFKPICLGAGVSYPTQGQSEDCLYANVWAPANATTKSKLPVWVFIQGGGYNALTNYNWNGSEVVEASGYGVVVVNFNYRVGIWGFLAGEGVELNVGLRDQRGLLGWVKREIVQFGGDPGQVVIHGASAGAGSVAMHLVAHGGRDDGLFHGAILESIFFPAQPFVGELGWQFDRVLNQTGCQGGNSTERMECLRGADVKVLQEVANHAQPFPGRPDPPLPIFYWTPCIDGELIEDLPYKLFKEGKNIKVPVMMGTASNEGTVFTPNITTSLEFTTHFSNNYPLLTDSDTTAILSLYTPPQFNTTPYFDPPNRAPLYSALATAYGESTFICPQTNVLNYLSTNTTDTSPTWAYRYNVHDDENTRDGLGVPHLWDAAAVWGPGNINPWDRTGSYRTYNKGLVGRVRGYYFGFVKYLDPNGGKLGTEPEWEGWVGGNETATMTTTRRRRRRLLFETGGTRMEVLGGEETQRCGFWLGLGEGRMEQR
ncbi:putative esterase lipase [Cercophora samala]|uniref:Carboxylic ester hydrolase n=1 Tax=Cercophora samala TaxID=330535 RepID=A0AA39ZI47_9PEZI|nr:putative esterase lipase [Cercophora samala]